MSSPEKSMLTMAAGLWLALACPALLVAQVPRPAPRPSHFARPITASSLAMTVEQVTFSFGSGRAANTNWGKLTVDPQRWRQATGLRTGYLNVFLYDGSGAPVPVVHNLLVPPPDDCNDAGASLGGVPSSSSPVVRQQLSSLPSSFLRPPARRLGTYIDLRPNTRGTGPLAGVRLAVIYSRYPFPVGDPAFQNGLVLQPATVRVTPVVVNAEGVLGIDAGDPPPPPPGVSLDLVGPPPPVIVDPPFDPSVTDLLYPLQIFQAASPNLESAVNQCAPLAMANVLGYLEERYNAMPLLWNLPHDHLPGLGQASVAGDIIVWNPVPTNSVVAQIDAYVRRADTFNANQGGGTTSFCALYDGVIRYLVTFGQQALVELRHQGGSSAYGAGTSCDDGTFDLGNITSLRDDVNPTWEWIFEQLQKGRGVAITYGRYDLAGVRTGAHTLRVWGAARYNGRDYLYTLDDETQGINTVGLRTLQWEVADTGSPGLPGVPDGRLNLNGTTWEVEFAASIEAKPTLLVP